MNRTGPDSLSSWMIAVICCFINMILFGLPRIYGIIFVASVSRFKVSREKACFPYICSSFMRNMTGPIVGYLGNWFGVRSVTAFGCFLGAAAIGACYFAENINTVTILWGVIYGIGYGLGTILLPVSINQHFDKHRATASGFAFAGGCLGCFILPPILEILLSTYGLSGTYLFISGFVLNCVPAALLLKKPNFEIKNIQNTLDTKNDDRQNTVTSKNVKQFAVETTSQNSQGDENGENKSSVVLKPSVNDSSRKEDLIVFPKNMIFSKNSEINHQDFSYREDLDHFSTGYRTGCCSFPHNGITELAVSQSAYNKYVCVNSNKSNVDILSCLSEKEMTASNKSSKSKKFYTSVVDNFIRRENHDHFPEKNASKKKKAPFLRSFSIFLNPIFNIVSISKAVYNFSSVCILTIIVDFSRDLKIGEANEKYVLMAFSVSDIIGRLGLGWVTDGGYMTVTSFTALIFAWQGMAIAAISWSDGFVTLLVTAAIYGLSQAPTMSLFPVIISEYMDHDKQTAAISSMHLFSGPIVLAISPLIGYFRDHLGAYDYLFYINAVLSLLCCLFWMFAPCIARCKKRR